MATLESRVKRAYAGKIKNLVFEGGGVWGIAYEGALVQLDRFGILDRVERVAGASAGAITACLLGVGYGSRDIGVILRNTDFNDFTDEDFGYARDTARLLTEYGWYKGDTFHKWVRAKIRTQIKNVSNEVGLRNPPTRPTFRELARWRKKVVARGFALPEFYCVGTNLSQQRREVYSSAKTPNMRIDDAVRASMSIPLFFACKRGDRNGKERDVIVDGGLTWNYPVNLFDDRKYLSRPSGGKRISYASSDDHVFNAETLGFRLDSTSEIEFNLKDWSNAPMEIDNILKYGWSLVAFIRAIANKVHLHKNDWSRSIFIDIGEEIGFTDFDLDQAQQDFLSEAGREGVAKFFEWRVSNEGKADLASVYRSMA